jgi:hypothetical protein
VKRKDVQSAVIKAAVDWVGGDPGKFDGNTHWKNLGPSYRDSLDELEFCVSIEENMKVKLPEDFWRQVRNPQEHENITLEDTAEDICRLFSIRA